MRSVPCYDAQTMTEVCTAAVVTVPERNLFALACRCVPQRLPDLLVVQYRVFEDATAATLAIIDGEAGAINAWVTQNAVLLRGRARRLFRYPGLTVMTLEGDVHSPRNCQVAEALGAAFPTAYVLANPFYLPHPLLRLGWVLWDQGARLGGWLGWGLGYRGNLVRINDVIFWWLVLVPVYTAWLVGLVPALYLLAGLGMLWLGLNTMAGMLVTAPYVAK